MDTTVSHTFWVRSIKRPFDLVLAVLLALLVSPILILAALAIVVTSPGPILFRQERVGRGGKEFTVLKLRTMTPGRRPDPDELVPLHHPEITRVGRVLRRLKIDELPQLFNVIAGSMSLVGPRPTLPEQVVEYDDFRRQRLAVRPGITGLAQVHGNTALPWDERILFDIAYVRGCSFRQDCWILARTVSTILTGEPDRPPAVEHTAFARFVQRPEGYGASANQ